MCASTLKLVVNNTSTTSQAKIFVSSPDIRTGDFMAASGVTNTIKPTESSPDSDCASDPAGCTTALGPDTAAAAQNPAIPPSTAAGVYEGNGQQFLLFLVANDTSTAQYPNGYYCGYMAVPEGNSYQITPASLPKDQVGKMEYKCPTNSGDSLFKLTQKADGAYDVATITLCSPDNTKPCDAS